MTEQIVIMCDSLPHPRGLDHVHTTAQFTFAGLLELASLPVVHLGSNNIGKF